MWTLVFPAIYLAIASSILIISLVKTKGKTYEP